VYPVFVGERRFFGDEKRKNFLRMDDYQQHIMRHCEERSNLCTCKAACKFTACLIRDCFVPTHDVLYFTCHFSFRTPRGFITSNDVSFLLFMEALRDTPFKKLRRSDGACTKKAVIIIMTAY